MTTESKKTDYTNSAINLCNPPALRERLLDFKVIKADVTNLEVILQQSEDYKMLQLKQKELADITTELRGMVDTLGSYQDLGAGEYAIKQRKVSITYIVSKVREFLRTYADAVIEEVVSKPKLEGLRKGGLVSQTDLDRCAETTESFAYIIKV